MAVFYLALAAVLVRTGLRRAGGQRALVRTAPEWRQVRADPGWCPVSAVFLSRF